jgi:hypothetical protein
MVLVTGSGLLGGVLLLVVSFRWGLMLMLNPEALPHLQSLLVTPLTPQPSTTTLTELQESLAAGQVLGSPVKLAGDSEASEWLIYPILAADTGPIVRLRVLQQAADLKRQDKLIDVAAVSVSPFAPETIMEPFTAEERQAKIIPTDFTAQQLVPLPAPPEPSPYYWLTLKGQWSGQGTSLQYGQLLVFDPERRRLDLSQVWSSPAQQIPQWVDLDGEGPTDLMINETTGIAPRWRGLRVSHLRGMGPFVQLQVVSWVGVPLDANAEANRYQKALLLARSGLWRDAHLLLEDLKGTLAEQWNPAAEAQLRLMARHAAMAHRQAEQDWSQPTQKIMALLIDGQWEAALAQLESSTPLLESLMRRLAVDQGQIWNRIRAAASLAEPAPAVFVWGGLTLEAKESRQAAETWLERQPFDRTTQIRLSRLWATIDQPPLAKPGGATGAPLATTANDAASPPGADISTQFQGVMGQARTWDQVPAGNWYFPDGQRPDLVLGEQWYSIEVPIVRRNQRWQTGWPRSVANADAAQVWSILPFSRHPSMTMVRWESSTLGVTKNLYVKGVKVSNGEVTLLASGAKTLSTGFAPLAFSDGALVWLSADRHSTPASHAVMPPLMEEIMRHQSSLPDHVDPHTIGALLQEVQLHAIDLTGDGQLEQVITFDQVALDQLHALGIRLDRTGHKTVMLTQDNQLIYSDLFQPQTLIALTNPEDGLPLSLVVHGTNGYGLFNWSATAQKFVP